MPKEVVHIDLSAETAALPQPTFTDVGILGTAEEAPPEAEFGEVNRYTRAADVSNDYGEDSDVHEASQAIAEMGASYWYVQVLEAVESTETLTDGESVENTPILGDHEISTSAELDIEFVTDDPPEVSDEYDVAINTDTGEVSHGETDIELTYHHADFPELDEFPDDVNRFGVADRRMGREHIGVLDEVVSWASSRNIGVVAGGINVSAQADRDTAREIASDVAGYVPSGDLMMIVDNSSQDLAAYQLGKLGTKNPWFDPYWNELPAGEPVSRGIGGPDIEETFEGGDSDGDGPVNVLISKAGSNIVSNSLTTVGAGSDYQFFDIGRTEVFIAAEIRRALTSARLRNDKIPFTEDGKDIVENVITDTVSQFTGGSDQPLSSNTVNVPGPDSLTDDDIANRVWSGISIDATLAGNVHQFNLSLTLGV